jgi:hypothetical protein
MKIAFSIVSTDLWEFNETFSVIFNLAWLNFFFFRTVRTNFYVLKWANERTRHRSMNELSADTSVFSLHTAWETLILARGNSIQLVKRLRVIKEVITMIKIYEKALISRLFFIYSRFKSSCIQTSKPEWERSALWQDWCDSDKVRVCFLFVWSSMNHWCTCDAEIEYEAFDIERWSTGDTCWGTVETLRHWKTLN